MQQHRQLRVAILELDPACASTELTPAVLLWPVALLKPPPVTHSLQGCSSGSTDEPRGSGLGSKAITQLWSIPCPWLLAGVPSRREQLAFVRHCQAQMGTTAASR